MADSNKILIPTKSENGFVPTNTLGTYFYSNTAQMELQNIGQYNEAAKVPIGMQLGMGLNAPMLDVATPMTLTPAVIVVTSVPAMYYSSAGTPTAMAVLTKELMETHAKSVSGIDFGYSLDADTSAPVGMDGQNFAVPTKTKRSQPSPSFTFTELSGNIVFNWARKWIWDIQHPDTNASMANIAFPGAYCMSAYAASFMVIQFDPTMRPDRIIDAAHYVNVFPTSTGDIGFERQIGQVKVPERSVQFNAIVQHNSYVKRLAIQIASYLRLHVHNYDWNPTQISGIDEKLSVNKLHYNGIGGDAQANRDYLKVVDEKTKPKVPYDTVSGIFANDESVNQATRGNGVTTPK